MLINELWYAVHIYGATSEKVLLCISFGVKGWGLVGGSLAKKGREGGGDDGIISIS
jgi:hypothetical protein